MLFSLYNRISFVISLGLAANTTLVNRPAVGTTQSESVSDARADPVNLALLPCFKYGHQVFVLDITSVRVADQLALDQLVDLLGSHSGRFEHFCCFLAPIVLLHCALHDVHKGNAGILHEPESISLRSCGLLE